MRSMTDNASIDLHRTMDKFATANGLVVTFVTEASAFTLELELVSRLVRAVTSCTVPISNWLMDNRSHVEFFMAFVTEPLNIIDGLKGVFVFIFLFMTERTVAGGHRTMYIFIFFPFLGGNRMWNRTALLSSLR